MEKHLDNPEKCDLVTPFELYGHWWRAASDEEKAVSGCLSFTPEYGLQLQLYDELPGESMLLFSVIANEAPKQRTSVGGRSRAVALPPIRFQPTYS
jgi:hypothetical protein